MRFYDVSRAFVAILGVSTGFGSNLKGSLGVLRGFKEVLERFIGFRRFKRVSDAFSGFRERFRGFLNRVDGFQGRSGRA